MSRVNELYADHLAKQTPTGAYQAPPEPPFDDYKAWLETAKAHSRHVTDCIGKAIDAHENRASTDHGQARKLYDEQTARDVECSAKRDGYPAPNDWCAHITPAAWLDHGNAYLASFDANTIRDEELRNLGIGDVEPRAVFMAEVDKLFGPESQL